MKRFILVCTAAAFAGQSFAIVFPTGPHAAFNSIPFNSGATAVMHQVFASTLFSNVTGGAPASITAIGFAPGVVGTWSGDLTLRLGYTNAIPGQPSSSGGLAIPTAGGGGGPNANGAMTTFFANPNYSITITSATSSSFSEFVLPGNFTYNPSNGNLLVEIVVNNPTGIALSVSRAAGSAESSRAYNTTTFGSAEGTTSATRMDFTFAPVPEPATMAVLGLGALAVLRRRRRTVG